MTTHHTPARRTAGSSAVSGPVTPSPVSTTPVTMGRAGLPVAAQAALLTLLLVAVGLLSLGSAPARAAVAPPMVVAETPVLRSAETARAVRDSRDSSTRVSRSAQRQAIRSNAASLRPMPVERRVVLDRIRWTAPTTGYRLTGQFGNQSYLWSSGTHTGLDFAAPSGTAIRSITEGVVKEAGYAGAYGYRTIVSLPDGGEVWYCHQSAIAVSVGQPVAMGQAIGTVGTTGNVTGSHLHLEIRHGDVPTDPAAYLIAHGVGL